ncbi:uncharacterized protein BKA78DRAFT_61279 [Phyllosticta capitalensis]|uniref:uncharacterized protein n=1 Tax=Phyllosticta capitalensis TaxID=121624 RepID=UPI00312EBAF3
MRPYRANHDTSFYQLSSHNMSSASRAAAQIAPRCQTSSPAATNTTRIQKRRDAKPSELAHARTYVCWCATLACFPASLPHWLLQPRRMHSCTMQARTYIHARLHLPMRGMGIDISSHLRSFRPFSHR